MKLALALAAGAVCAMLAPPAAARTDRAARCDRACRDGPEFSVCAY